MPLRLQYPSRYQLWTDLIRGQTDRMFVGTDSTPGLGADVSIEIALPELTMPIVVRARVLGRRPRSDRFPQGVWVRFDDREIEKCRRFLGLEDTTLKLENVRRARRVHHELAVRFTEPASEQLGLTRNISVGGAFVATPVPLEAGQHVGIIITLDDGNDLPLEADVAWASSDHEAAGLNFTELPEENEGALRQAVERIRAASGEGDHHSIVVADDDPNILKLMERALKRHGYVVYRAEHGNEALELIRHVQPALVVLDILMPGMDGADVCKMMRADGELVDIPVIFVSALGKRDLHQVADEAGATDYMCKPAGLNDLLDMIGTYLGR